MKLLQGSPTDDVYTLRIEDDLDDDDDAIINILLLLLSISVEQQQTENKMGVKSIVYTLSSSV